MDQLKKSTLIDNKNSSKENTTTNIILEYLRENCVFCFVWKSSRTSNHSNSNKPEDYKNSGNDFLKILNIYKPTSK